jgi:ATP-dependent Clp protease ATP-binding subunit ClpA
MTSNIGSQQIQAFTGRHDDAGYEQMKRQVTDALRGSFRPEFLNRIDEVIVFHALTDAELAAIVDLLLADLAKRIAATDLTLELTPGARALIAREGNDPVFGARPLKRTIQRLVENPFARALLQGTFKPGDTVVADADATSGTIVFTAGDRSVVAEAGDRRDARSRPDDEEELEPAAAGAGARGRSPLDLPPIDRPKRKDGEKLVN